METKEVKKNTIAAINKIKSQIKSDVIKDYRISNLVDVKTSKNIGIVAVFELSGRYDYFNDTLDEWKKLLNAYSFRISVGCNKLYVCFSVYFIKPWEQRK